MTDGRPGVDLVGLAGLAGLLLALGVEAPQGQLGAYFAAVVVDELGPRLDGITAGLARRQPPVSPFQPGGPAATN